MQPLRLWGDRSGHAMHADAQPRLLAQQQSFCQQPHASYVPVACVRLHACLTFMHVPCVHNIIQRAAAVNDERVCGQEPERKIFSTKKISAYRGKLGFGAPRKETNLLAQALMNAVTRLMCVHFTLLPCPAACTWTHERAHMWQATQWPLVMMPTR